MRKFTVPDMSCGHCVAAIEKAVKAADPAATVVCDLGARTVAIDSTSAAPALIAAISDAGYGATATG
ncbi:heavy-metal-associated domain-containing protein [Actibacterium sp. D379-3]